jgi:tetratricopeptide (TPR) repeat protein
MKALLVFLLCISPTIAVLAQNRPSGPDATPQAVAKAIREGRLVDAEKILQDAIRVAGPTESPQLSNYLRALGVLYDGKGRPADALAIYQRALEIDQKTIGATGDATLLDLAFIASDYRVQGKMQEAEQLLKQTIELARQNPDSGQLRMVRMAGLLENLASLYSSDHRLTEAEALLEEAMRLCESLSSASAPPPCGSSIRSSLAEIYRQERRPAAADQNLPANPNMPAELGNLETSARQYAMDGLYVQAEVTYRQAIAWIEKHPMTETKEPGQLPVRSNWVSRLPMEYNWMGQVLENQGRNDEAEASYKRAIELQETNVNPKQLVFGLTFLDLLNFYRKQGRLSEMEPIIEHGLELQEKFPGENSAQVAETLLTLADIYREEGKKDQSKYANAVPLYERALRIQVKNAGPDHPKLLSILTGYLAVVRELGDQAKATELQSWIDSIQRKLEAQRERSVQ